MGFFSQPAPADAYSAARRNPAPRAAIPKRNTDKECMVLEKKYYLESKDAVFDEVQSGAGGLSGEEAARRLERDGPNRLEGKPPVPLWKRFFGQMKDPMTIILLAAAAHLRPDGRICRGILRRCCDHPAGGDSQCGAGRIPGEQGGESH